MLKVGTPVLLVNRGLRGRIVDPNILGTHVRIEWEPGHDAPVSGWTLDTPIAHIEAGLIRVVGNGQEPEPEEAPVPEEMKVETPFDPFQEAFQLQFEI